MNFDTRYDIKRLFAVSRSYYERKIDKAFPDPSYIFDRKHPVVIYGAKVMGQDFLLKLRARSIPIHAFCDGNRDLWGSYIGGVKVISPQELGRMSRRTPILIASLIYQNEIHDILSRKGFRLRYPISFLNHKFPDIFIALLYKNTFHSLFSTHNQAKICKLSTLFEDEESRKTFFYIIKHRLTLDPKAITRVRSRHEEYFEPPIITFSSSEVFVDCGAFTGDTIKTFYHCTRGRFRRIYAFEPDRINFQKLKNTVKGLRRSQISIFNKGVFSSSGRFCFSELGAWDSGISSDGEKGVHRPFIQLDDSIKRDEKVTFIKMDIEGAEIEALKGAQRIIRNDKPKLAICIYHQPSDLWNIPLLIKEFNPKYRIYLRYYFESVSDIICYAI